jgi:sugar (pentulose or hexulose) kinase
LIGGKKMDHQDNVIGIELGSTRIKATLIQPDGTTIASGSHGWENRQVDGVWTYDMTDVWDGIAGCFTDLRRNTKSETGTDLTSCGAIGISAMMHGYIAVDSNGELLVPFRTWRNNITGVAAKELTKAFSYPIPQRWSIAHLYQAILNDEEHLPHLAGIMTLSGYVHMKLTGKNAIGIDDASGMFPIDIASQDFDDTMISTFDDLVASKGYPWKLRDVLPTIVPAGEVAGILTEEGARILDPTNAFQPGIDLCAPEGDAGTGMVATNAIRPRSGNVSAGTSVFAMIVLEKDLARVHEEIDQVMTPDGRLVAMVHSNNCTSDFDAWVALLVEAAQALGAAVDLNDGFARLMPLALKGEADAGGLLSYGYISGEHVTGFDEGRPLFVRYPEASFTLANFLRSHLFGALGALRTGLNILTEEEKVKVEEIRGHGGFFKTPEVGIRVMAAATGAPVSVMETAGEGGAWGMALLAAYMKRQNTNESLADFLERIFAENKVTTIAPDSADVDGFTRYFERYTAGLPIERAAVDTLK